MLKASEVIENELRKRIIGEIAQGCPLAPIEKCGLTDVGVNVLCRNCLTAKLFFDRYIRGYSAGNNPEILPQIQTEINALIKRQQENVANIANDDYVVELISLFLTTTANHINLKHQSMTSLPKDKLLLYHSLMLVKEYLENFKRSHHSDIDQGIRKTVEHLIGTIATDIINI